MNANMVSKAQTQALRKYLKSPKGRKVTKRYYEKTIVTSRGKAAKIRTRMKTSSKAKGYFWSDDWYSVEQIENIILHGKCAVSGLSFSVGGLVGTGNRNPFSASPDRIDNTKGYEPENVQWVVFIYNLMKNNFKDEDVGVFIEALKKHRA